jgi:hypothetical protein
MKKGFVMELPMFARVPRIPTIRGRPRGLNFGKICALQWIPWPGKLRALEL